MNPTLSPEFEKMIEEKVASGQYPTAKDVIEDALRRMQVQEIIDSVGIENVRVGRKKGLAQLQRGEYKVYSLGREVAEEIKATGRKRMAESKP